MCYRFSLIPGLIPGLGLIPGRVIRLARFVYLAQINRNLGLAFISNGRRLPLRAHTLKSRSGCHDNSDFRIFLAAVQVCWKSVLDPTYGLYRSTLVYFIFITDFRNLIDFNIEEILAQGTSDLTGKKQGSIN